jgi:HEAT repeat protein
MADVYQLIAELGTPDPAKVFAAEKALTEMAIRATAPGKEADRKALAATLAEQLNATTGEDNEKKPTYSSDVRNRICRLLGYILDADVVPALVEALKDDNVREMARYALDFNKSDAATQALADALDSVGPDFRTGVVNALGRRRGRAAMVALQKAARDADPEVRMAAVEALANFANPNNDLIIVRAAHAKDTAMRDRAHRARVRLAETLRRAGRKPAAQKIYQSILLSDTGTAQRRAAEIGLKAML